MRSALPLALAVALTACGDDPDPAPAPPAPAAERAAPEAGPVGRQTVADVLEASPRLSTLASLVEAAGLRGTLADTAGTYTLFAPENAAFGDADLDALRADPEALRGLLLTHVLGNRTLSGDVFGEITIETLGGPEITLDASDSGVTVRGPSGATAVVTEADLDADNGVVHLVDAVLAGPAAS